MHEESVSISYYRQTICIETRVESMERNPNKRKIMIALFLNVIISLFRDEFLIKEKGEEQKSIQH